MARRILVIDDSLTVRKMVELSFRGGGWTVELASSGADGVARALAAPPDVVLLDFVLPDMKATDVCERLGKDPRGRALKVILLSAKMERVRELFAPHPMVVDFMAKPFAPADLVARVAHAAGAPAVAEAPPALAPPPAPPPPTAPSSRLQTAANLLYQRMRRELAAIPEWAAGLGKNPPAMYFAKKLLTPEVVGGVLEALAPLCRETAPPGGPALGDFLRLLASSDRTGELRVTLGARAVIVYWQCGEIVGVAESEEPPGDAALLEETGRRLLAELQAAKGARYTWQERDPLPGWVQAHGRHLALDGERDVASGLAQQTLERLRRPSSWREAQLHLPGPDAVYTRATGFSAHLGRLAISASEQRVLTLVDGRHSLTAIAERSGIAPAEVARILHRLAVVDLVVAPAPRVSSRHTGASNRPVMILEPDRDGFHAPLRAMLARRPDPLDLLDLAEEPDLLGAIQRERPALVILNESSGDVGDVARAVRATPHLANVSLAAVLEAQVKNKMDDLAAAGFDAVLVKPVLYSDLSKLIASSILAATSATVPRVTENHGQDPHR
jgi:CheY-like chemotaxis protein